MRCAAGILVVATVLGGCQERLVRYDNMLGGLPGAVSSTPVTGVNQMSGRREPADGKIVVENLDGTKTLIARNGRHLLVHITETLKNDDEALFTSQVLSEMTKAEFYERGVDVSEAFKELKRNENAIRKLNRFIPMGEFTPGAYVYPVGGRVYRVTVGTKLKQSLMYTGMDMIMEGGNYRLRWFVQD